jgi:hypothetical protein
MKPRTLIRFLAGCLALAAMADSCAPLINVKNNATFEVRAVISNRGHSQVVSPSPGESSSAEAEQGPYTVTIIPDNDWLEHAKATRAFLNEQLANPDKLSGPQLLEVIRRLKDIAAKIKEFEAAGLSTACSGKITQDGGGTVTVSAGADGKLVASCR